ncbi:MAG: hypothetical protein U1E52_02355 [Geminicoccaceae bacterium]
MSAPEAGGWGWLDAAQPSGPPTPELCRATAACLASPNGRVLLRHLRQSFLDRRLPPTATDAELRHVEGQRSVVAHLLRLMERGRDGASPSDAILPEPEASR